MISKPMTPMDYDAQYDSETLSKAQEIKKDKPRHKRALLHTAKKAKALGSVLKEGGAMVDPKTAARLQTGSFPSIGGGQ